MFITNKNQKEQKNNAEEARMLIDDVERYLISFIYIKNIMASKLPNEEDMLYFVDKANSGDKDCLLFLKFYLNFVSSYLAVLKMINNKLSEKEVIIRTCLNENNNKHLLSDVFSSKETNEKELNYYDNLHKTISSFAKSLEPKTSEDTNDGLIENTILPEVLSLEDEINEIIKQKENKIEEECQGNLSKTILTELLNSEDTNSREIVKISDIGEMIKQSAKKEENNNIIKKIEEETKVKDEKSENFEFLNISITETPKDIIKETQEVKSFNDNSLEDCLNFLNQYITSNTKNTSRHTVEKKQSKQKNDKCSELMTMINNIEKTC